MEDVVVGVRWVVLVACGVLMAGCTGSNNAESPAATTGAVSAEPAAELFDVRRIVLAYDVELAAKAANIAQCMKDAGYDYSPDQAERFPKEYLDDLATLDEKEYAQKWGYGVGTVHAQVPSLATSLSLTATPAAVPATTPEEIALRGEDGRGGCAHKASSGGDDDPSGLSASTATKRKEALQQVARDPRVVAHYIEWSECMKGKDFHLVSPLAAHLGFVDDIAAEPNTEAVAKEEINVAVASVECGQPVRVLLSSDLSDVWKEYSGDDSGSLS